MTLHLKIVPFFLFYWRGIIVKTVWEAASMASPIKNSDQGGKRPGQKFKSLLVWQYLLKHTDDDHAASSEAIKEHLREYGITADRHSIARDIDALNELFTIDAAAEIDDRDRLNYEIIYDTSKRGYKIIGRPHDFEELRLLAECVRASKFISKSQEEHLLTTIEDLCSESQIEELHNEVYLVGRNKTSNRHIMRSMEKINRAIKAKCKISFKYLKYTLNDRSTQVARRGGKDYIRSPYKLIINDGNYYLLAYDSEKESMMTYRLDRMQGVEIVKQPRDGAAAYDKIDMRTYTQRVFSMFGGEDKFVSIRFTNDLLDTAVERFGNGEEVFYRPDGKGHFVVSAHVEISKQFYAWVCGFYNKAKIISPPEVVEGMKEFLHGIADRYESE